MNKLLKLGALSAATMLTAGAYAADTTTFSVQSMTVPEFLSTFFSHQMKAPYQIDTNVIEAHANDTISLRYQEPLSQEDLYERVSGVLREQYDMAVTRTSHGYEARMAE